MRNKPLKGMMNMSSPLRQNESTSDSITGRIPTVREVKVVPAETYNPGKDAPGPGKVYSKSDQQLKAMQQGNPIATLFTGRKTKT